MATHRARRGIALGLGLTIAIGACRNDAHPTDPPPPPIDTTTQARDTLSVLFIGNSLTYTNDLPGTLARLAAAVGDRIRVQTISGPKMTLLDHLRYGSAAASAIQSGGWDFVVLQNGLAADSGSRDTLVLAAERFDTLIRSVGARPALFMIWPGPGAPDQLCLTWAAYLTAARAVNGVLLPAGVAWHAALQRDPTLPFYLADGHPAPLGTYLAAITIYQELTGHDPRQLGPYAVVNGVVLSVSPATVRMLQDAAYGAAGAGGSSPVCRGGSVAGR